MLRCCLILFVCSGLLGITIRHDSYQNSENCLRVLEVVKGSPAESAGLTPESDYILGTASTSVLLCVRRRMFSSDSYVRALFVNAAVQTFNDATELFELVMDHVDKSLDIYVYNSITDRVALKRLKPTMQWGGEGCLGLDVGQGYLHALPSEARKTNGVACSLGAGTLTSTTGNAAPLPAVGATAAPPPAGNLQRTTREAKVSRRKAAAAASASSTPVKISSPPADSSTAQTSPGSPGLPSSGPISPARLPLAATLSPRSESKRIAGTKTAR